MRSWWVFKLLLAPSIRFMLYIDVKAGGKYRRSTGRSNNSFTLCRFSFFCAGSRFVRLAKAAEDCRSPYVDETMNPTSENLSPSLTRKRQVAEEYCVAAMRGGEFSEAKERPQTKVNSFRPMQRASWRTNSICRRRLRGVLAKPGLKPNRQTAHPVSRLDCRLCGGVWSGDVRGSHGLSQDRCRGAETTADDRALIVAKKRVTTVERRRVSSTASCTMPPSSQSAGAATGSKTRPWLAALPPMAPKASARRPPPPRKPPTPES